MNDTPHLITVATLPCESRNINNAREHKFTGQS